MFCRALRRRPHCVGDRAALTELHGECLPWRRRDNRAVSISEQQNGITRAAMHHLQYGGATKPPGALPYTDFRSPLPHRKSTRRRNAIAEPSSSHAGGARGAARMGRLGWDGSEQTAGGGSGGGEGCLLRPRSPFELQHLGSIRADLRHRKEPRVIGGERRGTARQRQRGRPSGRAADAPSPGRRPHGVRAPAQSRGEARWPEPLVPSTRWSLFMGVLLPINRVRKKS